MSQQIVTIKISDLKNMNDITAQDFLLYQIIKNLSNEKGFFDMPMKELSSLSNISVKNLSRNLNRLSEKKYIRVEKEMDNLNKKIIYPIR